MSTKPVTYRMLFKNEPGRIPIGAHADDTVVCNCKWGDGHEAHCNIVAANLLLQKAMTTKPKKRVKTGAQLIAAERKRQIRKEGWDACHDAEHDYNELLQAAICYAKVALKREHSYPITITKPKAPRDWPWDDEWWKPKDVIRDLVRAGALIAAELDRIQRSARLAWWEEGKP